MEIDNIKNITKEQKQAMNEIEQRDDEYLLELELLLTDYKVGTIFTRWSNNQHLKFYYIIYKDGKWKEVYYDEILEYMI